jgi:class 3 adenylate cyclase
VNAKEVFPNHTVPQFEIDAGYVNGMSGMIACAYVPIILDKDRAQWEDYALTHNGWVNESIHLRETYKQHLNPIKNTKDDENDRETIFQGDGDLQAQLAGKQGISRSMYHLVNGSITPLEEHSSNIYAPLWQITPPVPMAINADLFSSHVFLGLYASILHNDQSVISPPAAVDPLFDFLFDEEHQTVKLEPHSFIAKPVHASLDDHKIVGMVVGLVPFHNLLDFLFSDRTKGMVCVFTDGCGTTVTYKIDGNVATFLGYGDLHDSKYDSYKQSADVIWNETAECALVFSIYPSSTLENAYITKKPLVYASIVVLSFALTSVMIILYDRTVTMRQEKTMRSALQNGALVASLFPAIVRDRLLEDTRLNMEAKNRSKKEGSDDLLKEGFAGVQSRPIADFFPNTTLMFADIAGFTAWSSTREPFQVFELLETIYGAFDELAKRRRIFKVETVGDCYVAVCGISEARDDHAVAMAKFARECLSKMRNLTKMLEVKLGPDTSSLSFRVGLHSGPVTGGVLRGDNARFQLFGDTVNTAARMESTGIINRIQMSQTTATLLMEASKGHWVQPREEVVYAKGKGEMMTYWLTIEDNQKCSRRSNSSRGSERTDSTGDQFVGMKCLGLDEKTQRLANWNAEVLLRFLKLIVAKRGNTDDINTTEDTWDGVVDTNVAVVDEVAEIIMLPTFSMTPKADKEAVLVSEEVQLQLCEYVTEIANMYQKNAFHNFEHASHVTMVSIMHLQLLL